MLNHLAGILKQKAEQLRERIERATNPENKKKMKRELVPVPVRQNEILRGKNHTKF